MGENGVIIIGGYVQGLGLLRSFVKNNIQTIVINNKNLDIVKFSKYLKKYIVFKKMNDSNELKKFLINLAKDKGLNNWTIFPTSDSIVYTLSKYKSLLEQYYKIPTPKWDIIKYAYNKKLTYQLADKLGIPTPKTYYPNDINDAIEISKNISFPCILKPAIMHKFNEMTGNKVVKVLKKNDLIKFYKELTNIIPSSEILIQEIIEGGPGNLFSFGSFMLNNELISYIIANRKRQIPMDFGKGSTFVESTDIIELKELSLRLLKEIGFYGLSEVEFIRDPRDEKFKLLEINPRSWKWITITDLTEFPLIPLICNFSPEIDKTERLNYDLVKDFSNVKWIHFWQDLFVSLKEILKGNLSMKEYLKTFQGEKKFAVASWNDPLPFIFEPLLYCISTIKKRMRKVYRFYFFTFNINSIHNY